MKIIEYKQFFVVRLFKFLFLFEKIKIMNFFASFKVQLNHVFNTYKSYTINFIHLKDN